MLVHLGNRRQQGSESQNKEHVMRSQPEKSPQDSQRLERTGVVCSKSLRLGFKSAALNLSFGPFKEPQTVNLSGTLEKTGKESSVSSHPESRCY